MKLFGSSGIRAVFNKDLLNTAFCAGLAAGTHYGSILVGTDTRTSRDAMKHAVISGILAAGAEARDAGIVPTPTLAYATREFNAGVMVTASHNPPEYNGMKFLNPDGSSFDAAQQEDIETAIVAGYPKTAVWEDIKHCAAYPGAVDQHLEAIVQHFPGKLKIKAVVDAGCGAAAEVTPRLLERLGCQVIPMNCYPSGFFPRVIEPAAANLQELCDSVKENSADIGIAHDGDADRMMAVDERGRFITGDALMAVFARALGAKDMVTTLDASMAIDELGVKVRRTRIGDTWVSDELKQGGDFGGETSGAWIFPQISLCPDGIFAAARIAAVAAQGSISRMVDDVPVYPLLRGSIVYTKLDEDRLEATLEALGPDSIDRTDGFKLNFPDGWLLARPSGTEPKIRLTAEAKTEARARELFEAGMDAIKDSVAAA